MSRLPKTTLPPGAARRFLRSMPVVLLLAVGLCLAAPFSTTDDLPGPGAHLETIPAGSLIIPMDNTLQAAGAPFNVKAYGLINNFLQSGIPLKWAIRAGKAKDGTDFTATAQRIAPTAASASSVSFAGGPFIVHRNFAQVARGRIAAFGNNVAVYETTADVTIDIRYNLTFKPNIAVNTVNASIHTDLYDFAAIPNYTVIDISTFGPSLAGSCYTVFTEPHTSVTTGIAGVRSYVLAGGNFLAECLAIETYENDAAGRFQTTLGIVTANVNAVLSYPNADLAFSQFVGALEPAPGGSHQDWQLAAGSAFANNAHLHADNVGASPAKYAATVAKLYNGPGGMIFYLGGHNYGAGGAALGDINGQRMVLNTIFVPNTRAVACNADFFTAIRSITGTVYHDVNGDGSLADGVGATNVTVRLYADVNNNGVIDTGDTFVDQVATDATGSYTFQISQLATGSRYLVAVNSKTLSPGAGFNGGFAQGDVWAEQTYGDDPATAGIDLAARFGGRSATISDNFTTNTIPANNTYEHVARLDATAGDVTGLNFGFSFNVVVNTRGAAADDDDSSASRTVQGSLRQFLQNANAISGANTMRFVPVVPANASSGGGSWWRVSVTNALPALGDALTTIDGRAYSSADGVTVRDDNPGLLGAGGVVGVDAVTLGQISKPEFEITDGNGLALGLDVLGNNTTLRRLALSGFGTTANSDAHADIRIGNNVTGTVIEQNLIGSAPGAFADPGATRSGGDHIRSVGGDSGIIQSNLIGFSAGKGIALQSASTGWRITANEVRGNGIGNTTLAGIDLGNGTGDIVTFNLITAQQGAGLDMAAGGGSHTVATNTISGNGSGGAATAGARVLGASSGVSRNVITANSGAGVMVASGATQNMISQNSIYANGPGNGQVGIDLLAAADNQNTGTAPFVTINDNGDADAGGNNLFNFPVIVRAEITNGGTLILRGFARPGSVLEFFIAEADPSGFGEGRTYLTAFTEGSGADTDATTGTYTNAVNGLNQGTDTTAWFRFVLPLPGGVAAGVPLTATATLPAEGTSEFSGLATVVIADSLTALSGFVYLDANHNLQKDSGEAGTGLGLFAKIVAVTNAAGPALQAATVNAGSGAYSFTNIGSGTYNIIIDNNTNLSDVTPTLPAGWSGTEMPNQTRLNVPMAGVDVPNQNFGLVNALTLTGRVFRDTGQPSGTANDGIFNGAETGLPAVTVRLTDNSGSTTFDSATTDGAGNYILLVPNTLSNGVTLKVVESNPGGFLSSGASVGTTAGTYSRTNDTVTLTYAAGIAYTGVNFGDVPVNTFAPDSQQAGLPGTFVLHPHTFVAGSGGQITLSAASAPSPAIPGWSQVFYRDANCNGTLDPGEPPITAAIVVNAGDKVCVLVKDFIPAAAPLNAQNQLTVTALFDHTGASPVLATNLTRTDLTTVGNPSTAGLTLLKAVDKPTALPGETITYTITYGNNSDEPLANVIIYDATPAFTSFLSATNSSLPTNFTAIAISAPGAGSSGAVKWTFTGTLGPGRNGTVQYSVTVSQ